jgi:GntR family transcriptional regulator of vanillate catabolism
VTENYTSAEMVAERLREVILRGELPPGEKLHQSDLAEQLGVSRTPLRTALAALADSGLIVYESNRGYRVREFSAELIRGAFIVRAELEALACALAADNMTSDFAQQLFDLVSEGDRLLEGGQLLPENHAPYRDMNVRFHKLIQTIAGNPWISDFVPRLHNVPLTSDRIILWEHWKIIHRSHDDHHRIAEALSRGDGIRAGAIMREHVLFALDYLLTQLDSQPDSVLRLVLERTKAQRRKSPQRKHK